MVIIKRINNILFFLLSLLVIILLLDKLGIIGFILGLIKSLSPLLFALFLSVCLEKIILKLMNKGLSRKKASIVIYASLIIIVILFCIIFLTPFINQMRVFIETLPLLLKDIEVFFYRFNIKLNSNNILNSLQIRLDKIVIYFTNVFNIFMDLTIIFFASFFISYDYDNFKNKLKNIIPSIIKKETIYFFVQYEPFFSKYIYSLLIDSLITFSISFLLFIIFRIDYYLIAALLITITNLIPFIGTLIALIPLTIIGYSVSFYFAIISIVIVIFVQVIESNIIQPLIFKNVIKLTPIETIIGILIFSYLFGIFGMIFSPLLVVAFKLFFIEKYNSSQVTL